MHPTAGRITQHYGTYPQASGEPWGHTGTDYAGAIGAPVVSIAPGTVLFADWNRNMADTLSDAIAFVRRSDNSGIVVVIQHEGWISVSAHLNETHLNTGDKVSRGQRIGSVGMTGRCTGAHLHYEVINKTNQYTSPFGRYNPLLQIAHEDAVEAKAKAAEAARKAAAAAAAKATTLLTVTATVAHVRTKPDATSPKAKAYPEGLKKGAKVAVLGYVAGKDPYPNDKTLDNAWVKTVSGYYIWANAVGNSLKGLKKLG